MKKALTFLLFLAFLLPADAQDTSTGFAPFVSRFKATDQESSIVLSWKAPTGIKGYNVIYRYTEEITESNVSKAVLVAKIDVSNESYVDVPPDSRPYYYAVLVEETGKSIHKLLIPYRNKTSTAVAITVTGEKLSDSTIITGIEASAIEDSILVSFVSTNPSRETVIFRNTTPILTTDDLISSLTPTTLPEYTKSYKDFPIPGIEYYYAVLDAGQFKVGKYRLVKGQNTTSTPVKITDKVTRTGLPDIEYSQLLPLPFLSLSTSVDKDTKILSSPYILLPDYKKLSEKTRKTVDRFLQKMPGSARKEMKIEILPAETATNETGEAYNLQAIVKQYLNPKDMAKLQEKLTDFFRTEHSEEVSARGYFYMGQADYFMGKYDQALVHFLLADDRYYVEIQPWLDACFARLTPP